MDISMDIHIHGNPACLILSFCIGESSCLKLAVVIHEVYNYVYVLI